MRRYKQFLTFFRHTCYDTNNLTGHEFDMNKETENNKETEKKILNTDSELDQVHDFGGYKKPPKNKR